MAGLVCLFSTKALLILAIIIAKIVYLGFLVSYTSSRRVALIKYLIRLICIPPSTAITARYTCVIEFTYII